MSSQENGFERMRQTDIDAEFNQAHQEKVDDLASDLNQLKATEQPLPPEPVDAELLREANDWEQAGLTEERQHELELLAELEKEQQPSKGEQA